MHKSSDVLGQDQKETRTLKSFQKPSVFKLANTSVEITTES